jgi:hypothetical protein
MLRAFKQQGFCLHIAAEPTLRYGVRKSRAGARFFVEQRPNQITGYDVWSRSMPAKSSRILLLVAIQTIGGDGH